MKTTTKRLTFMIFITALFIMSPYLMIRGLNSTNTTAGDPTTLPDPRTSSSSVAETIFSRRSTRSFSDIPITIENVSDLLWSTIGITVDGITGPTRASPSAGATNPLMIYLFARDAEGLEPGVYRYHNEDHSLEQLSPREKSMELRQAALNQFAVSRAQANIVIAADYEKTMDRYSIRGITFVHLEAGHAAQNVVLMAESLGLGSVIIGSFSDGLVKNLLGSDVAAPLLIIPVGSR
ncbi:MAG: SagB-type dehydrogenase domain [Thermotogales bacterium 46_20]|nr:MAG: SagB-type dehydrogenase domain [Thermotogales bacterium 46_20]